MPLDSVLNITLDKTYLIARGAEALARLAKASADAIAAAGGLTPLSPSPEGSSTLASITVDKWGRVTAHSSGAEAQTLQGAYSKGSSSPQYITLDGTRGGVVVRDAATPIGARLFGTTTNGGTELFGVYADHLQLGAASCPAKLYETGGASLAVAGITDGYLLKRVGTNIVSVDPATIGVTDHGALTGLTDDDHTIYYLANGSRALNGNLQFDGGSRSILGDTGASETAGYNVIVKGGTGGWSADPETGKAGGNVLLRGGDPYGGGNAGYVLAGDDGSRFGVGAFTARPDGLFHVMVGSAAVAQYVDNIFGNVLGPTVALRKARGSYASKTTVAADDELGSIEFYGYDGNSWEEAGAVRCYATGTVGDERVPSYLSFWTATDAAPSVPTEACRINSNQSLNLLNHVLYGSTAADGYLKLVSTSATGTTDYISLCVGTDGGTEALRAINSGFVGVGVSPLYKFHVQTSASGAASSYPAGTWTTVIDQHNDASAANGLLVVNRYQSTASTIFEVGTINNSTGAYTSGFKVFGDRSITFSGTLATSGILVKAVYPNSVCLNGDTASFKDTFIGNAYNTAGCTGVTVGSVRTNDGVILSVNSGITYDVNYIPVAAGTVRLVVLGSGLTGIGEPAPLQLLSLKQAGTATADTQILSLTNSGNAAAMTNTRTSILFNQWYYDAATPKVADAGSITVGTEGNWTSTASTQDAYMAFSTAVNGTVTEWGRFTSSGWLSLNPSTTPQTALLLDIAAPAASGGEVLRNSHVINLRSRMHEADDTPHYCDWQIQNQPAAAGAGVAGLFFNVSLDGGTAYPAMAIYAGAGGDIFLGDAASSGPEAWKFLPFDKSGSDIAGDPLTIRAGKASGAGTGGTLTFDAGASGGGANGDINIGAAYAVEVNIGRAAGELGFFGVEAAARAAAYTQTYSTAARTNNPASTAAFTSTPAALGDAATLADLNTLREDMLMMAQIINSLIDDGQAYGLAQ